MTEFVEGEGATAGGGDEHVDGEEGAGNGGGVAGVHDDVADGDASAGGEGASDFGKEEAVFFAGVLVDDGANPGEVKPLTLTLCPSDGARE